MEDKQLMEQDYIMQEILEQPQILQFILKDKKSEEISMLLRENGIKKVIFTGSGDSYCAAKFGTYLGRKWLRWCNVRHYAPFNFVNYVSKDELKDTAVIGISVSGNTPRVVEALRFAKQNGALTIGITDNPQGKLVKDSSEIIRIHASPPETLVNSSYSSPEAKDYVGYHHDVAQTKTYLANIAVISKLISSYSKNQARHDKMLESAFELVTQVINMKETFLEIGKSLCKSSRKIIFVGSGINSATSLFGAYKMFEFTLNGYACDIEEFCHTEYFISDPSTSIIFIAGDEPSWNRIIEIEPVINDVIKVKTVVLTGEDIIRNEKDNYIALPLPQESHLSPIVFTIAVELMSYSLAKALGFDVNMFRGGRETEKYVGASYRTIRQSKIRY
ncbi:MAG: SIS domain-containing protein [Candidatus Hodarchaeales archaeon]